MDEAKVRAAFEDWHIHASSVSMTRFGAGHGECGEYVHRFIQSEWLAWRDAVRWATSQSDAVNSGSGGA